MTGYGREDYLRDLQREKQKREEDRWTNWDESHPPNCPRCGKPMGLDRGDGCVHERMWYCPHAGCHYNDRCADTVAIIVGVQTLMDGETEDEARERIKEVYNRDSR